MMQVDYQVGFTACMWSDYIDDVSYRLQMLGQRSLKYLYDNYHRFLYHIHSANDNHLQKQGSHSRQKSQQTRNHEASRRSHIPDRVHLGVIRLPAPIPLYSSSFLFSIAPNDIPSASNEPLANSVPSAFAGHNCKCQDPSGTGPQWDWATEKICRQMSTSTCWATYHADQHHQVKLRTLCT